MSDQTPPDTGSDAGGAAEGQNAPGGQFSLQRIYVKDLSFESPRSPEVFRSEFKPRVKLDLSSRAQRLETDVYEVVLTVSVETRGEDDAPAYIVEVQQAGIFGIGGFDEPRLQHMLSSYCPSLLFPYAREAIDNLVLRGSFPALLLAPVNFDALYSQALKQQQEAGAPADGAAPAADDDATTH